MQQHSALNYCAPFCVSFYLFVATSCNTLNTFHHQEMIDIDLSLKPDFIWDWTVSYPRLRYHWALRRLLSGIASDADSAGSGNKRGDTELTVMSSCENNNRYAN